MRKIIYFLICLLFVSMGYSVDISINSLTDETIPLSTFLYTRNGSFHYLPIPSYSYLMKGNLTFYNNEYLLYQNVAGNNQNFGFLSSGQIKRGSNYTFDYGFTLSNISIYIQKNNAPSGNVFAQIYTSNESLKPNKNLCNSTNQISNGDITNSYKLFNLSFDCPLNGSTFFIIFASTIINDIGTHYFQVSSSIIPHDSADIYGNDNITWSVNGDYRTNIQIRAKYNGTVSISNESSQKVNFTNGVLVYNTLNRTTINNILADGCVCKGCQIMSQICNVPINITTSQNLSVVLSLSNITASYGVDNCSNSLGISSNATSFNITFIETETQQKINVNTTIETYNNMNFSVSLYNTNHTQLCIYPGYLNLSNTLKIRYSTGGTYSYYYVTDFFDSTISDIIIYVDSGTSQVKMTVKDAGTSNVLPNTFATMYKKIDGNWEIVSSKYADVAGIIYFNYIPNTQYRFFFSRALYDNYIFELDPITETSYTIPMIRSVITNVSLDYQYVGLAYSKDFSEQENNNFTFMIQSPYGFLESYNYTVSYPSGTFNDSGINSLGESFSTSFTLGDMNFYDLVTVNFCYDIQYYEPRCFQHMISIKTTSANYTLMSIKNKTYGLGIFERSLIVVIISILIVGWSALAGQPVAGMGIDLVALGYLVYIGFIPLWIVLFPMFLGFLMIALGGER